jgi:GAF domain-containing protein
MEAHNNSRQCSSALARQRLYEDLRKRNERRARVMQLLASERERRVQHGTPERWVLGR